MTRGKHSLRIEQIHTLIKHSPLTEEEILGNINGLRIGCLTHFDYDKELFDFIASEKGLR